jgi:2-polyprenyl-6-methoxyphenol hydroxylase-like FAD-dependent oxidoreductase
MSDKIFDIGIIGYGPVGATLSGLLSSLGLSVVVIEKNKGVSPTARAINTDSEQLRTFNFLNVASEVIANSRKLKKVHFTDSEFNPYSSIDIPEEDKLGWPPTLLFYQPELETIIRNNNFNYKNLKILENTEAVNIESTDPVRVDIKKNRKDSTIYCKYLIGCDGANSFVRKYINSKLIDFGFDQDWIVIDAHTTKQIDISKDEAKQICDPNRLKTYVPGRRNHKRFEFKLLRGETKKDFTQNKIWELLSPWINKNNSKIERAVVYKFHACIADKWRDKNIFIAGDAAHQMPPFLGAGMGTGIRDAFNLAWKIFLVINGKASESLLETYQLEREPHANWTIQQAKIIGEMMEQYSYREKGEKYIPSNTGYGEVFPHLTNGYYGDPTDGLIATPFCRFNLNGSKNDSDGYFGWDFGLISKKKLTKEIDLILKKMNIKVLIVNHPKLKNYFKDANYLLIRPDKYLFSRSKTNSELKEALSELEKQFSLIT